jgi:Mg-chelatase subunit ChlI
METSSPTKQLPREVEEGGGEEEVTAGGIPEMLSKSFVHRSLRRRLWKACQEDDVELAVKIYNATQHDLEAWLHKEEEDRKSSAATAASVTEREQAAGEASSSFTPQHGSKASREGIIRNSIQRTIHVSWWSFRAQ